MPSLAALTRAFFRQGRSCATTQRKMLQVSLEDWNPSTNFESRRTAPLVMPLLQGCSSTHLQQLLKWPPGTVVDAHDGDPCDSSSLSAQTSFIRSMTIFPLMHPNLLTNPHVYRTWISAIIREFGNPPTSQHDAAGTVRRNLTCDDAAMLIQRSKLSPTAATDSATVAVPNGLYLTGSIGYQLLATLYGQKLSAVDSNRQCQPSLLQLHAVAAVASTIEPLVRSLLIRAARGTKIPTETASFDHMDVLLPMRAAVQAARRFLARFETEKWPQIVMLAAKQDSADERGIEENNCAAEAPASVLELLDSSILLLDVVTWLVELRSRYHAETILIGRVEQADDVATMHASVLEKQLLDYSIAINWAWLFKISAATPDDATTCQRRATSDRGGAYDEHRHLYTMAISRPSMAPLASDGPQHGVAAQARVHRHLRTLRASVALKFLRLASLCDETRSAAADLSHVMQSIIVHLLDDAELSRDEMQALYWHARGPRFTRDNTSQSSSVVRMRLLLEQAELYGGARKAEAVDPNQEALAQRTEADEGSTGEPPAATSMSSFQQPTLGKLAALFIPTMRIAATMAFTDSAISLDTARRAFEHCLVVLYEVLRARSVVLSSDAIVQQLRRVNVALETLSQVPYPVELGSLPFVQSYRSLMDVLTQVADRLRYRGADSQFVLGDALPPAMVAGVHEMKPALRELEVVLGRCVAYFATTRVFSVLWAQQLVALYAAIFPGRQNASDLLLAVVGEMGADGELFVVCRNAWDRSRFATRTLATFAIHDLGIFSSPKIVRSILHLLDLAKTVPSCRNDPARAPTNPNQQRHYLQADDSTSPLAMGNVHSIDALQNTLAFAFSMEYLLTECDNVFVTARGRAAAASADFDEQIEEQQQRKVFGETSPFVSLERGNRDEGQDADRGSEIVSDVRDAVLRCVIARLFPTIVGTLNTTHFVGHEDLRIWGRVVLMCLRLVRKCHDRHADRISVLLQQRAWDDTPMERGMMDGQEGGDGDEGSWRRPSSSQSGVTTKVTDAFQMLQSVIISTEALLPRLADEAARDLADPQSPLFAATRGGVAGAAVRSVGLHTVFTPWDLVQLHALSQVPGIPAPPGVEEVPPPAVAVSQQPVKGPKQKRGRKGKDLAASSSSAPSPPIPAPPTPIPAPPMSRGDDDAAYRILPDGWVKAVKELANTHGCAGLRDGLLDWERRQLVGDTHPSE